MQYLFVYGTLKDPKVQKQVVGRALNGKKDSLIGYKKGKITLDGKVYPIIEEGIGEISGFILQISDKDLKKLDEYETPAYKRIKVALKSGKHAWVYVKP